MPAAATEPQALSAAAAVAQGARLSEQPGHVNFRRVPDDFRIEREVAVRDQVAQPGGSRVGSFRQLRERIRREALDRLADDLQVEQNGVEQRLVVGRNGRVAWAT
jgi:hypothetical protein